MHSVESKSVAVIVSKPHFGVIDYKLADLGAVGTIEVDSRAPGCPLILQVRAELTNYIACRPEMV